MLWKSEGQGALAGMCGGFSNVERGIAQQLSIATRADDARIRKEDVDGQAGSYSPVAAETKRTMDRWDEKRMRRLIEDVPSSVRGTQCGLVTCGEEDRRAN